MEAYKLKKDKQAIRKAMQLYLVTDRYWLGKHTLCEDVEKAVQAGVTCVQLREKKLNNHEFIREAGYLKYLCIKYAIPFIINDNVDVMLAVDADGVHVGQSDMKAHNVRQLIGENKILGVSVQSVEQALEAQGAGADYLGVGAVFHTGKKKDAADADIQTLKDICNAVQIPVVAIGGIGYQNILELKDSGIAGVAVISAILAQKDIHKATQCLKEICQGLFND